MVMFYGYACWKTMKTGLDDFPNELNLHIVPGFSLVMLDYNENRMIFPVFCRMNSNKIPSMEPP